MQLIQALQTVGFKHATSNSGPLILLLVSIVALGFITKLSQFSRNKLWCDFRERKSLIISSFFGTEENCKGLSLIIFTKLISCEDIYHLSPTHRSAIVLWSVIKKNKI
jgi:hypothetical protein